MPLKVLHVLATAIVFAMEVWTPPDALRWAVTRAMGRPVNLHRHAFATMFVDAALDVFRYWAGLFLHGAHELRSVVIPPNRHTQQSAELWGLCCAMRPARCFGRRFSGLGNWFTSGGCTRGIAARVYLAAQAVVARLL